MCVKDLTPELAHLGILPESPPFSPNLLLHPDSFPGTKDVGGVGFQVFIVGVFLVSGWGGGAGPPRRGQRPAYQRGRVGGTSLLSDLQFPRHLAEAAGQTEGEGRPVVPDGALEGGRERLGALPGVPETSPQPLAPWRRPLAPGCGSARACRCAASADLRAGRARSSTRRSRPRCGRRGTGGRRCRTDLRGSGRSGSLPGFPRPPTPGATLKAPEGIECRGSEGPGSWGWRISG